MHELEPQSGFFLCVFLMLLGHEKQD